jgi:hypothetical protein
LGVGDAGRRAYDHALHPEEWAMESYEEVDYSPHDDSTFNVWVRLGAADPDQQSILDNSPLDRHEIKLKSSSPEAEQMIHEPLGVLIAAEIPRVTERSRIDSHIPNHHIGLRYRIIRVLATVDDDGNVSLQYDKQP